MSEFNAGMVDKLMAEDAIKIVLQTEFEEIVRLRQDLEEETKELEKEIALLCERRDNIAEPYITAIREHEENIRYAVSRREKTFQCSFGQAIYRRGAQKVTWNDSALMGYAAAGHPEIEQFRSESEGKPSIVLKIGDKK